MSARNDGKPPISAEGDRLCSARKRTFVQASGLMSASDPLRTFTRAE